MRENLIDYLLDALSDEETARVEEQLAADPKLRQELEILRLSLEPLEADREGYVPPDGLADLTCEVVAKYESENRFFRRVYDHVGGYSQGRWSLADIVVAAGIILATGILFLPALAASRYQSRILACQNNLRVIGDSLHEYTNHGSGYFPRVPTHGNRSFAGIYGPMLYNAKLLKEPRVLRCPSSDLAHSKAMFRLPTLQDIDFSAGIRLAEIKRYSGGSYGYNLGIVIDGVHQAPKNRGRSTFALMSDAPSQYLEGRKSANHGGYGQNILYEDGHIRFIVGNPQEVCVGDNPLINNKTDIVEAGDDLNDAVIGNSLSSPLVKTSFVSTPEARR